MGEGALPQRHRAGCNARFGQKTHWGAECDLNVVTQLSHIRVV